MTRPCRIYLPLALHSLLAGGCGTTGDTGADAVAPLDGVSTVDVPTDVAGPVDVPTDAPPAAVLAFPPGFHFGTATAAHQIEGGQHNNWTLWETLPAFAGRTAEPSGRAVDHYHRFAEDFDRALDLGLDTFRLSIEWSRIEPERGRIDTDEVAHYRDVFDALRDRDIRPSVTLHHFTEPVWLTDLTALEEPFGDTYCANGPSDTNLCFWGNPEAADAFADFCRLAATTYGDVVDEWATFNELLGFFQVTTLAGDFPPGLNYFDEAAIADKAMPILRGLLDAHAACYRAIHEADTEDADGDGVAARVGLTTGTGMARPADPDSEADRSAAAQAEHLASFLVFDALTSGQLDADWDTVADEDHPTWADTLDFLGLQYYASTVVVGMPLLPRLEGVPCVNVDDDFLMGLMETAGCPPPPSLDFPLGLEGEPRVYGRQHDPEGLGELLGKLHVRYPGIPIVITEHGFADDDRKRAGALVRHLAACHAAIEAGVPLEGYYHWSLLDNFEWGRGFAVRFGLYRVDYDDDLARQPTLAADVYRAITAAGGLTAELLDEWGGTGPLP